MKIDRWGAAALAGVLLLVSGTLVAAAQDEGSLSPGALEAALRAPDGEYLGSDSETVGLLVATCTFWETRSTCSFRNEGQQAAEVCVRARLTGPGGRAESETVCSGSLPSGEQVTRELALHGDDPSAACTMHGVVAPSSCHANVEVPGAETGSMDWMPLAGFGVSLSLVLLAALWVWRDGKRREAPNPELWALGTVLFCAIALPAYLVTRSRKSEWERLTEQDAEDEPGS